MQLQRTAKNCTELQSAKKNVEKMAAAAKPLEGQRCMHWLCKDLVAPDLSKLNKRDQTNTDDVWNCVNSPTRSVCCSQIWLLQSSASSIYASLLHLFVFFCLDVCLNGNGSARSTKFSTCSLISLSSRRGAQGASSIKKHQISIIHPY